jgi:hypothetical protein
LSIQTNVSFGIAGFLFDNSFYKTIFYITCVLDALYIMAGIIYFVTAHLKIRKDLQDHRQEYQRLLEREGDARHETIAKIQALADEVNAWSDLELRRERTTKYWLVRLVGAGEPMKGVKVRQSTSDLDVLMELATEVNYHFQDLVAAWCAPGAQHVPSPVKRVQRTIEKAHRKYYGDLSCITDLVRCSFVCKELSHALQTLQNIMSKCSTDIAAGHQYSKAWSDSDKILRVHRVRNRFQPGYNDRETVGYRDISVLVEVAWVVGKDGMCWFVPVSQWDTPPPSIRIDRLVCEIQIQVGHLNRQSPKFAQQHERYIHYRDSMSR